MNQPDTDHAPDANNGGVYAILDSATSSILGSLQLHKHEAAAIRTFGDIASLPDSIVGRHPADFSLVRLGWLSTANRLVPDFSVILSGATWSAAQQLPEGSR